MGERDVDADLDDFVPRIRRSLFEQQHAEGVGSPTSSSSLKPRGIGSHDLPGRSQPRIRRRDAREFPRSSPFASLLLTTISSTVHRSHRFHKGLPRSSELNSSRMARKGVVHDSERRRSIREHQTPSLLVSARRRKREELGLWKSFPGFQYLDGKQLVE